MLYISNTLLIKELNIQGSSSSTKLTCHTRSLLSESINKFANLTAGIILFAK
jgi:hypothetical protein